MFFGFRCFTEILHIISNSRLCMLFYNHKTNNDCSKKSKVLVQSSTEITEKSASCAHV